MFANMHVELKLSVDLTSCSSMFGDSGLMWFAEILTSHAVVLECSLWLCLVSWGWQYESSCLYR